jgi:hypothetical protein
MKTCRTCQKPYTGAHCPDCYTANGQHVANTAAILAQAATLPLPGDTVIFDEEPGVTYAVLASRFDGTTPLACIAPLGATTGEWVYADWK